MVTAGFALLAREEFTPVTATAITAAFPADSSLQHAADKPTLLLFLHPRCPCSHATVRELDELLAQTQGEGIAVTIVFVIPSGVAPGWEQGDLWNAANALPGVRVVRDIDGVESLRFHVKGSGHALLYDQTGRLVFSGGITPSRGHEGDNRGRSAIVDYIRTGHTVVNQTPVFGCSLL
jgi:hypothetical protein